MKILFLTKELPYPVNSGARMRTWHYVRGLVQAGAVYMVCFGKSEGQEEGVKALREIGVDVVFEETMPFWQACPKIIARLGSLFLFKPFPVLLRESGALRQKVFAVVQEAACDVVICDGIHMAVNIPFELSCRKILDEHNVESTIIKRFAALIGNPLVKFYALWECWKFRQFEQNIWPRFDEIHVCSGIDLQEVKTRSGHVNVKVVPNGVAVDEFPGSRESQSPENRRAGARLVYSGLMGWQPNNDAVIYFIKAIWPLIKRSRDSKPSGGGAEFVVVGKNPSVALQALAEKDSSIMVTGFVDDVKPYIYGSDVFVVPLRIGSGTRLKILEAMAMDKAIVSTAIGCEGLDVTHGKNILIADRPQDFADCVVRLLNDDSLREKMAAAGRNLVEEKYDWELIEKNLGKEISGSRNS